MSALLPLNAARQLQSGISEYLSTTFALADIRTQDALSEFVGNSARGMFQGPFVRTRMPFAPAADGASDVLDWTPTSFPFRPYVHQAAAFERLSSRPASDSTAPWRRPDPTLVVTGTGSGKTEAFLYPVLDHAVRARKQGVRGVKALLLYPMNALATDQAERLTRLLTTEPGLAGVTAGLYTGEHSGSGRTTVSSAGLITDRATMREDPPDLLLTNYKMLDQLLLRPEDADLWRISAAALQYVVLDEFHTYDAAQGTDVALLLRRLGLVVVNHLDSTDTAPVARTDSDRARPLGRITPVATSATLGDEGDTAAVRNFAETIFGEPFGPDAVLTESRLSVDEWMGSPESDREPVSEAASPAQIELLNAEVADRIARDEDTSEATFAAFCTVLLGEGDRASLDVALERARDHELVASILSHSARAISLSQLTSLVLPTEHSRRREDAEQFLTHVFGALSHLRAEITARSSDEGRTLPSFESHLWVRELSRLDRAVATSVTYRWHDDGPEAPPEDPDEAEHKASLDYLPAIFCRHCGRAGWMTALEPGTETPTFAPDTIRKASLSERTRTRALISATQEVNAAIESDTPLSEVRGSRDSTTSLMWLDPKQSQLRSAESGSHTADQDPGVDTQAAVDDQRIVPVLLHTGPAAKELSERQTCPACGTRDSIRYIGSAVATLLSVALSNLFGTRGLDAADKRTLVFSDSVQDASHRAGFVQARSHAFALRTAITTALGGESLDLSELARRVRAQASSPVERYHLLHPSLTERRSFAPFWNTKASSQEKRAATMAVDARLRFDLSLEFGLRSTVGRTLSLTGTAVAAVDASPAALRAAARSAWGATTVESALTATEPSDTALEAWARVVVERILRRGGIDHHWLRHYVQTDGNTWHVYKREARAKGMPGFPLGGLPAFPRVGTTLSGDAYRDGLDVVASSRSWYARWTARHLSVTPDSGAKLVTALMDGLAHADVLTATTTETNATVYGIKPERVLVDAEHEPAELRCDVCHNATPAAASVRNLVAGVPCLTVECPGHLHEAAIDPDNYYRRLYHSANSRAVVAREHTGLLENADRARIERQFKSAADEPGAPNVLVATPTLEMGIDIGDLSSVMLSSLPDSVASYVQRVGRAGRLTGNSLVVALVRGRGKTLPVVHDPLSMINGAVQPPAAFLSAVEILRRQFLAHAIDSLLLEGIHPQGRRARDVYSSQPDAFVAVLGQEIPPRVEAMLDRFLGSLSGSVSETATADLRAWATGVTADGNPSPHSLTSTLLLASHRWRDEYKELLTRLDSLDTVIADLAQRVESPGASEQDRDDHRAAEASRKATLRQRREHIEEYWISAFERYGLLPGYQLLDDTVDLTASISTLDPETMEWDATSSTFTRSVSSALTELAPGNSFYADRMRIEISSVNMGAGGDAREKWRLCPVCSHSQTVLAGATPGSCPACGAAGYADSAQVIDVVPLRRVAAQVTRDSATVDERHEDRVRRRFTVARTLSWKSDDAAAPWFVDNNGFGAQYLRRADVRWLNLGTGPGAQLMIGGDQPAAPLFRLCEYCGHLDSEAGANSRRDHRPWCVHANTAEEHSVQVALGRTLATEGVLLYLPSTVSTYDGFAMPSLIAALKLGFKRVLGGDPSHLDVASVMVSQVGHASPALLLHDRVPGGTGYLAGFTSPDQVWTLLHTAWEAVRDCPCAGEDRLACPRCLLPHTAPADVDRTSRAAAETSLLTLLAGDEHEDEAPSREAWSIGPTQKIDKRGDSVLEVRFRHAFKSALDSAGAKIAELPAGKYSKLQIRMPGSKVTWTLQAQVDVPNVPTRPDYVLRPDDSNRPTFAIYADGAQYHATPLHNRVVDDVVKREAVRDVGWIPWAVTHEDIDELQADGAAKAWPKTKLATHLSGFFGVSPARFAVAAGDPVTFLVKYLADPDVAQWRSVGDASAAYGAADGTRNGDIRETVRTHTRIALTGDPRRPSLIADLSIDASDSAVAAHGYLDDWRWFLRWSNLLSLRKTRSSIRAIDGAVVAEASSTSAGEAAAADLRHTAPTGTDVAVPMTPDAETDSAASGVPLSAGWRDIVDQIDPDFEESSRERELVNLLALHGVPVPDYGEEVAGHLASFSWPDQHIAVIVSDSEDMVLAITSQGWRVIDGTTGDVVAQVKDALAVGAGEGN
ncbi:ATP-dependent helicase YprA (DUF1998 family) [Dietzia kunjamensis]|uniref:DEAD/DEAH box helicase n=1 Tax=Dietzia kunjamensis TaxID=322509 RepID=UPI000E76147D|nr:DEAD/DEAH box helicase [Dietzia kunjamensis]MBB1011629.1 DEAD/DEAH box helicase [Dietzia kunjamensis]RKE66901.1 ATP-dependent helicase YprA (DUF1998 family) [Dietzia kunjamensis]